MIEEQDDNFDRTATEAQLNEWGATAIEEVSEDMSDQEIPKNLKLFFALAALLLLVPPVMIFRSSGMTNRQPRLHVVPDMDWQDKRKTQTMGPTLADGEYLFANQRSMQSNIPGTLARGDLEIDTEYFGGYKKGTLPGGHDHAQATVRSASSLTSLSVQEDDKTQEDEKTEESKQENEEKAEGTQEEEQAGEGEKSDDHAHEEGTEEHAEGEHGEDGDESHQDDDSQQPESGDANQDAEAPATGGAADAAEEPEWVTYFPAHPDADEGEPVVTKEKLLRGRERFEIYCSACHGYSGNGDGLVNQRAVSLAATGKAAWTAAKSLHDPAVKENAPGRIYDTITNGRGTMGPYKSQITAEDRWAIVMYVKALQETGIQPVELVVDEAAAAK